MDTFIGGVSVKTVSTNPIRDSKKESIIGNGEDVAQEIRIRPFKDFLKASDQDTDKLELIIEFFGKDGDKKALERIKEAESKLSKDPFDSRVNRLYRYARLISTMKKELQDL